MNTCAKKIGLALSGGGFRASLYHLGLIRFLRDAGLLAHVSHITAVSGGSVFAGHLLLHWDRYNGSPDEFDAAAAEFLAFVRLDVRNRIIRRFPLNIPFRWPMRRLGYSTRKMTRTGLLEFHYQKHLYGDTSLFELPEKPKLHFLSTNLSEGCLCSFNRDGLLMVRRNLDGALRLHRIHTGLATVAMAVTASSAFPGFFPPVELTGAEVGATNGEFGRQAYTDGGVFDNLGVRMFRCLERPLLADTPLTRDDFIDFSATVEVLRAASRSSEETPLHRLAQLLVVGGARPELLPSGADWCAVIPPSAEPEKEAREELLVSRLGHLLRNYPFHRDPVFAALKPVNADAESLLVASRLGNRDLHSDDQLWLSRQLLEVAFRQATNCACFRRLDSSLDGVLVSDVGKPMEVKSNQRSGGLVRTSMRSTDILMDRVWQLEIETFHDAPGFVFAPATDIVSPTEDPNALHPEIQRQLANIRTDLDRFSALEISSLVRHGYCIGRKACRSFPQLFGTDIPDNGPWDPLPRSNGAALGVPAAKAYSLPAPFSPKKAKKGEPAPITAEARTLQASAVRRIWSTLLDYRDWVSYVYVPIVVPILVLMPYLVVKYYERSHRINQLVDSLSQGSRDLEVMSRLLDGPMKSWNNIAFEEVRNLDKPDFKEFEVLQDSRIIDLRQWNPAESGNAAAQSQVYGYRRLKVLKRPDSQDKDIFRITLLTTSPTASVRFPQQSLEPKLMMSKEDGAPRGEKKCVWQMSADFSKVPAGDLVDLIYEHYSHGEFLQKSRDSTTMAFGVEAHTAEVTRWFLMPAGREYRSWRIVRYETGKPNTVEPVKVVTEYLADDYTILAYKLLSVDAGYTYEVTWFYK